MCFARVIEKTASVMAGEKLSKKVRRVVLNTFTCPGFLCISEQVGAGFDQPPYLALA